jgi:hypothetical protein
VKQVLAFLLALVIAFAGAVGILLLLQSRDDPSLTHTVTTAPAQTAP